MNNDLKDDDQFEPDRFEGPLLECAPFMESLRVRVVKCGRTTGWTAAELNDLYSDVRVGNLPTTELLAIDFPGSPQWQFADHGDSGSAVFNYKGQVVGIIWGGSPIGSRWGTYITPIRWLFKDIEAACREKANGQTTYSVEV
jgi:hypothetical protein